MIFISFVQVSAEASNPSVTEFKQFMETLKSNIEKTENNRTVHHLRYVNLLILSILAWRWVFFSFEKFYATPVLYVKALF